MAQLLHKSAHLYSKNATNKRGLAASSRNSSPLHASFNLSNNPKTPLFLRLRPHPAEHRNLKCNVAEFIRTSDVTSTTNESILCARFAGHDAAVASAIILEESDTRCQIVTSSLDKTVKLWKSSGICDELCNSGYEESCVLTPQGGPVFSMLIDEYSCTNGTGSSTAAATLASLPIPLTPDQGDVLNQECTAPLSPLQQQSAATISISSSSDSSSSISTAPTTTTTIAAAITTATEPNQKLIYMGTHGRQVVAWKPPNNDLESGILLDGFCGWVRALASTPDGRWLFTAACNHLRVWDMARAVPFEVDSLLLDRGDILSLVAGKNTVYAATSDGSLHSFPIESKSGHLLRTDDAKTRQKAHADRVTSLELGQGLLYSASYDGTIKAWDAKSLEIVADSRSHSHAGERVHCLALKNNVLYSGGGDCYVRRWSPQLLQEIASPLHAHNHSVRALAVGNKNLLVSGDKGGEVAIWKLC